MDEKNETMVNDVVEVAENIVPDQGDVNELGYRFGIGILVVGAAAVAGAVIARDKIKAKYTELKTEYNLKKVDKLEKKIEEIKNHYFKNESKSE